MSADVEDGSKVARTLDDRDAGRQQRDVADVNVLQLLAEAQLQNLRNTLPGDTTTPTHSAQICSKFIFKTYISIPTANI